MTMIHIGIFLGSKIFHTIHLDENSDVKGYVDGVDLSELQATVLRKNSSVVTDGESQLNLL